MEVKVDVCVDKDMVSKIEKKKTIIDNVFGFNQEERNLLNNLFAIFLERIAVNETTYILLDKDSEKSELMFIYITCLYANYKSMGEADLTFSNIEEVRDEIFEFVYRLIDLLDDIPNDNKVHIASGEDGYYLVIS
jgi:hypothetical protein